jgi:hypothetical protein
VEAQQPTPAPMSTQPATFGWVFAVVLVLSLGLFGLGVYLAATRQDWTMLAAGSVSVVASLLAWPLAATSSAAAVDRSLELRIAPTLVKMDALLATLQLISEQQLISDRAKQVAFREKDRDAFRRAIQEDLTNQDFDAAVSLVDEMEQQFGPRGEVERLRSEVAGRRDDSIRRQLDTAIAVVDRYVEAEQWPAAFKEAERLMKVYPDQVRVQMLSEDIEQRRSAVKRTLLARWSEAVRNKHVDDAIFILRKLDLYLSPQEASGLEEDARMIFKEKIAKLRTDFTGAVQAHNWREAKKLADVIMSDFPNTQMAKEVRDMMPTLEERLRELQAAGSLQSMAT